MNLKKIMADLTKVINELERIYNRTGDPTIYSVIWGLKKIRSRSTATQAMFPFIPPHTRLLAHHIRVQRNKLLYADSMKHSKKVRQEILHLSHKLTQIASEIGGEKK